VPRVSGAAARQGGALRLGDDAGAAAAADGLAAAPGGGAAAAGRGYREGSQEATWLLDLMTGCVAVLLTVHNVRRPAPTCLYRVPYPCTPPYLYTLTAPIRIPPSSEAPHPSAASGVLLAGAELRARVRHVHRRGGWHTVSAVGHEEVWIF